MEKNPDKKKACPYECSDDHALAQTQNGHIV